MDDRARSVRPAPQGDLFGEAPAPVSYRPDPDAVRVRLQRILNEARAAKSLPWPSATLKLYRVTFPQMSLWLPPEEANQMRFDFECELTRLKAA
ncbi:MAG: hypothetical protein QM698_03025 [Micropepsaceae bacterium]